MIISNRNKFIWFFPIGHTATTSLFFTLKALYDDEVVRVGEGDSTINQSWHGEDAGPVNAKLIVHKHFSPLMLYRLGYDKHKFISYTKIAVARSPYTWVASMMYKNEGIERFSENTITTYLNSPKWKIDNQRGKLQMIDKLIKFEDLSTEFTRTLHELGVDNMKLLYFKRPGVGGPNVKSLDYMQNYTRCGFDLVNRIFKGDFEYLNYKLV